MRNEGKDSIMGGNVAAIMGINVNSSSTSVIYVELMNSRRVIAPIVDEIYDADQKKPTVGTFVKQILKIKNIKRHSLMPLRMTDTM